MADGGAPDSTPTSPNSPGGPITADSGVHGPDVFDEPSMFLPEGEQATAAGADAGGDDKGGDDKGAGAGTGDDKGKKGAADAAPPGLDRQRFPDAEYGGFEGNDPIVGGPRKDAGGAGDGDGKDGKDGKQGAADAAAGDDKGGRRQAKQNRYDQAVAGVEKAQEETAGERRARLAAEAENADLKKRLEAYERGEKPPAADQSRQGAAAKPAAFTAKKPDVNDFDSTEEWEAALEKYYGDKFAHDQEARTAAATRKSEADARTREQNAARAADAETWDKNRTVLREAKDFKAVSEALAPVRSPWHTEKEFGQILAPALDHMIRFSPKGGEVGLWLGRHVEAAKKLAELPGHPQQHPAHMAAWDRMTRGMRDPIPMLQFMASDQGKEWFEGLNRFDNLPDLVDAIADVRGRLAAVTAMKSHDAEHGGGETARPVRTSEAPDPGTSPQGTSAGELTNAVENFHSGESDATFDKVFRSRFAKRRTDANAGAANSGVAVVPSRAQLGT